MLTLIKINHFITINTLALSLPNNTTIITGETGTGKSILLEAIQLALGARRSEAAKSAKKKIEIALTFDLTHLSYTRHWLLEKNLAAEQQNLCVIKRIITKDGRTRSFVNDHTVNLQTLRTLSEQLIHIHVQHEHHSLLNYTKQRMLLDLYAQHQSLTTAVYELAIKRQALIKKQTKLVTLKETQAKEMTWLLAQMQELDAANLQKEEFTALDEEHKKLSNHDAIITHLNKSLTFLQAEDTPNVLRLLQLCIQTLENVAKFQPHVTTSLQELTSASLQISEVANQLTHLLEKSEQDPKRLAAIDARLTLLFNLARKYKITPHYLFDYKEEIAKKLTLVSQYDEALKAVANELDEITNNYAQKANELSISRTKFAVELQQKITAYIQKLGLPHAIFTIALEKNADAYSPFGLEKIIFFIKTNPGQPSLTLSKIISGGELSRISLAIYMATAEQYAITTLLFDEVDTGVSGATAEIIGKFLRTLGMKHQIFCITHLPQVAAQGHHHLLVKKHHLEDETITTVTLLNKQEKINELARMLGGITLTKNTLTHAHELLENANEG